jgi:hypothetical protein
MVRDQRAEAASTWTHDEKDPRREGHVDKRHGVHGDNRRARGEHPADKHREVDRELRRIATQRTGLDAQEARWLREADRHQIWRRLGFSTALEYLEDVFGYAPRTALERLRVAKELGKLPELEAELARGALPYSAAKELSRVMTRNTQAEWLARARGKNLRDIEEMVAGRKKGDRPDDLPDPALVVHEIRLKLTARTKALWEQMRAALERECDGHLDDDQLAEVVTRRVLGGDGSPSDKPPRPPHRIVVHQCDDCDRAWQEGRGRWIQLSEADHALAACDAVTVHEHDQATSSATTSDIPAKTRKRVWARDRGRCRVPGCRATRHIDIHHLIPRALGGTHDEWSLCLLCSGHHKLHHEGILSITGRAPDELVFIRDGKRLVDARSVVEASAVDALPSKPAEPIARNRFAEVTKLEHAKQALRQLGFKARAARAALEQATAHVGTDADVAQLVHAALQLSRPDAPEVMAAATRDIVGEDEMTTLATQALVQLGFPRPIATNAVNAAIAHVSGGDLAALIKEALRRTGP